MLIHVRNQYTVSETPQDEPLIFDAHFLSSLLQTNDGRVGLLKWAHQMKAWTYGIWLNPLCRNEHWTLYVVVFPHKVILCIDFLHGLTSSDVLPKLCGFIEKLFMRMDTPVFNWSEWFFHRPVDIPSQKTMAGGGFKCGIHVCVWAYIICHGKY
ncbi:Sentrin-specific protease [Trachymyrmex cornetzi]|uniref:Sentrin-specific protease n=1 Tax=Trachymyrmex cornetzi TaxID=471704 RepID=A0A151IWL0_9HYME|nr:Sentrin-specific protease [Trachymyrmex cornetzi]